MYEFQKFIYLKECILFTQFLLRHIKNQILSNDFLISDKNDPFLGFRSKYILKSGHHKKFLINRIQLKHCTLST